MAKWVNLPHFLSKDGIHLFTLTEIILLILLHSFLEQEYTWALKCVLDEISENSHALDECQISLLFSHMSHGYTVRMLSMSSESFLKKVDR